MRSALAVSRQPDAPAWFPDWTDQACAIIATGPSAKREKALGELRGRFRVIAIKEAAVDLAPWADVAYGCDGAWWAHRRGLAGFSGLRVSWDGSGAAMRFAGIHSVKIPEKAGSKPGARQYVDRILTAVPGVIGSGNNSGFQALNLAVQFGARRIVLIGFDLAGKHYYGRNEWPKAGNPDERRFDVWRAAFAENVPLLKSLGVEVVNASQGSTLTCFRHLSLDQVINEWSV